MLSVLAELQRELIVANANDGFASARARGRVGGRRPKLTEDQAALAQRLYDEREKTVQQIADMFDVPRSTVYGHLNKTKTVHGTPLAHGARQHITPRNRAPRHSAMREPGTPRFTSVPGTRERLVRILPEPEEIQAPLRISA
ncbi:helix-turn-helix domain-containing protein [Streptomyces asiaticus]|uniref:helix-turn-helix domain-containing protein n=1 Tax=Streptomyces asiaticus TaxID=114695 RepID=UPI003F66CBDF